MQEWKQRLGRKASVRYVLREGDHPFSEAIGMVASVAPDESGDVQITIVTRRGTSVVIPLQDVVAAKHF